MTKTRTLTTHLARAAAKSWNEYLAENDNDAEKAGKAARADVASREGQNSSARRFMQAYRPVIEGLGLDVEPSDAESAADKGRAAVTKLKGDASAAGDTTTKLTAYEKALKDLGIDPSKLDEGVTSTKARIALGDEAGPLKRQIEYGKVADALNWDGAKLARVLRDEASLPEKRTVKVKVTTADGKETEEDREVWGFARKDEAGKDSFVPVVEHPEVKGFEASLKRTADSAASGSAGTIVPPTTTPIFVSTPASVVAGGATFELDAHTQQHGSGAV